MYCKPCRTPWCIKGDPREVIKNGNEVLRRTVRTVEHEYKPTTAEEKQDRRNEMKARATLLMALPNKDQLKFYSYQDAKYLIESIEKRYRGNKESKKYSSKWKTHALIWRNKVEIETISLDDLYNNLKIYELELTGSSSTSQNTAHRVSTTHTQGRKLDINGQRVSFDKSKVECYNCHKHGYFARECRFPRNQEYKERENNTRTIVVETPTQNDLIAQDGIRGYDWSYQAKEEQPTNHVLMAFTSSGSSSSSDSEVDSCYKTSSLESVEAILAHYKKNKVVFEKSINVLKLKVRLRDNALNEYKMNLEKAEKERDQLKQTLKKFQNSSKSLNDLLESQVINKFKTGSDKGFQSVPSPLSGNFIPRKPDLTFIDKFVESDILDVTTIVTPCNAKTVENKGVSNTVESNVVRMNSTSAPIIED
ncbi:ribonuclease H-like domain-containing protein [Tanacetum coccineum]